MRKMIILFVSLFLSAMGLSQNDKPLYSFFAAGHTYGEPGTQLYGLHPPFADYISQINNYANMELGFLTGDVVVASSVRHWDSAQADIAKFDMPIHIAAGNHGMGPEFVKRFKKYYYSFKHREDLFIILAPGLDAWNIKGEQLAFLRKTLDEEAANVKNIFIFMHELIWWSPDNEYQNVKINYLPHYPGSSNYETEIKPLLLSYSNLITIYAGDLGCNAVVSPYMYHKFDNLTLIASGMGSGKKDNIIITDVYRDSVHHRLVAISGGDPDRLGEFEAFSGVLTAAVDLTEAVTIYPKDGGFYIKNSLGYHINLKIYDLNGKLIQNKSILKNNKLEIFYIYPGIYFVELSDWRQSYVRRVLVY